MYVWIKNMKKKTYTPVYPNFVIYKKWDIIWYTLHGHIFLIKTKAVSENCCLDHRDISVVAFFFGFQIISVVVSRSFPGISDRRTAYCICVSACLIHNDVILI